MNPIRRVRLCSYFATVLVSIFILSNSCKKTEPAVPPVLPPSTPVFTLDHISISVGGKDYIQFVTRCTSETVKLAAAIITDPGNKRYSYEYYSDTTDYQIFYKNESFTFPEDFLRQPGLWKCTFSGQRYQDDSDFTSIVNDSISD